jgi:Transport and Golgi organisation 2
MCTALLSIEPGLPVLLVGVRDELTDRAWKPPGRHWPQYRGLVGGQDLLAGGTWLAVAPQDRRVACVLNGRGQAAPAPSRRTRGVLPLQAAAGEALDLAGIAAFDPFHLLTVEPGRAMLQSWDGERLTERELGPGLHFVVNSGLAAELATSQTRQSGRSDRNEQPERDERARDQAVNGREHELARIAYFLRRFRAAARPPGTGESISDAWGAWLPLVDGDGLRRGDSRALIVRRDLGHGRTWGTTSISLVALSAEVLRYDFTGAPGDPAAWRPVPVAGVHQCGMRDG